MTRARRTGPLTLALLALLLGPLGTALASHCPPTVACPMTMTMPTAEPHCAPAQSLSADCCPSMDSSQAPPEALSSQGLGPAALDRATGSLPGADTLDGPRGEDGVGRGSVTRARPLPSLLL